MKKLLIYTTLFCTATLSAQNFSMTGKWESRDTDGLPLILTFDEKGFVWIGNGEFTMGGEAFEMKNGTGDLKYEVDLQQVPHRVDFIMYVQVNGGLTRDRKQGYFNIIDSSTMELRHEALSAPGTSYDHMHPYIFKRKP